MRQGAHTYGTCRPTPDARKQRSNAHAASAGVQRLQLTLNTPLSGERTREYSALSPLAMLDAPLVHWSLWSVTPLDRHTFGHAMLHWNLWTVSVPMISPPPTGFLDLPRSRAGALAL